MKPEDEACEFSERYHILNPKEEASYPPASPKNLKYLASTVKKREVYKDPGSGHIPSKQWPDSLCCFLNYRPRAAVSALLPTRAEVGHFTAKGPWCTLRPEEAE
ncbi:unnamed protein product [Rangifer tarandus platyrhynchus]|uniref:Uncharacterized protein n=2 Tax=Rangifer tarandus platyrhynchus TaxID=3082113 RepID=A0ABN8ZAR9_RANTA|nr:unnamed protein product [Rangifer tarandus platyrhynchus]